MVRLRRRFRKLHAYVNRKSSHEISPEEVNRKPQDLTVQRLTFTHATRPPTPKEETIPKTQSAAIYNKYLCPVCRPAMDYIRGVQASDSETYRILHEGDWLGLRYHHNKRSLQESIDDGCYVCTAMLNSVLSEGEIDARSARNLRLLECNFSYIERGDSGYFGWVIVETEVRPQRSDADID